MHSCLKDAANNGGTSVFYRYFRVEAFGVDGVTLLSFHPHCIFIDPDQHGNFSVRMNFWQHL